MSLAPDKALEEGKKCGTDFMCVLGGEMRNVEMKEESRCPRALHPGRKGLGDEETRRGRCRPKEVLFIQQILNQALLFRARY